MSKEQRNDESSRNMVLLNADSASNESTTQQNATFISQMDSENAYNLGESYLSGEGVEKGYKTAFDYYSIAANQGHAEAQYRLGYIYDNGLGLDQDYSTAIVWYKKAASQKHIASNYRLGRMHFCGEGVEQDNDLVFEYFKVAAELGDAKSQFEFGLCYSLGYGVEENLEQSIPWILKAAAQGLLEAQYSLGISYYYGAGVDIDYKVAFKFMFESKPENHGGFYMLGEQYFFGKHCEINYEIAFECYKISAIVDVDYSYSRLGTMYQYGYGTEKDENLAIECYEKATPNDTLARIFLAELYHSASKEFQDFSKAYQWYQQIKGSGKSFALRGIGLLYEHGDLFEQDYQKAFDYYLQSAEDKNLGAYLNLARLYYFGCGVDQSYTKCLEWLAKIETEKPTDGNTHVYVEYGKEEFWRQSTDSKDRAYSILSEDKLFGKACFFLGVLYIRGEGCIVRDAKKAARYFRMALGNGVKEAQIYIEEANEVDLQSLSLVANVSSNDDDISK